MRLFVLRSLPPLSSPPTPCLHIFVRRTARLKWNVPIIRVRGTPRAPGIKRRANDNKMCNNKNITAAVRENSYFRKLENLCSLPSINRYRYGRPASPVANTRFSAAIFCRDEICTASIGVCIFRTRDFIARVSLIATLSARLVATWIYRSPHSRRFRTFSTEFRINVFICALVRTASDLIGNRAVYTDPRTLHTGSSI